MRLKVIHCCSFLVVLLILMASYALGYKCYTFLSSSINSVCTLCFVRRNSDLLSSFKVAVALETHKYFLSLHPVLRGLGISSAEKLNSELYVVFFKFKFHLNPANSNIWIKFINHRHSLLCNSKANKKKVHSCMRSLLPISSLCSIFQSI